jgi:hypothetical protein
MTPTQVTPIAEEKRITPLIVRRVAVNRSRTPQQALVATCRNPYVSDTVVINSMPRGAGDMVEVCFFTLGEDVNVADIDKEYELRGLTPADPLFPRRSQ